MNDFDFGYAVGIFDGERSTTVTIAADKKLDKYIYFRPTVQLHIRNTNKEILRRAKDALQFNGRIYIAEKGTPRRTKVYGVVENTSKNLIAIIQRIKPFSSRKDELTLAEEACRHILSNGNCYFNYEDLEYFERVFVNENKKLKGKASIDRPRKYHWKQFLVKGGKRSGIIHNAK